MGTCNHLIHCLIEFIHMVTSEANEICGQTTRKTIAPEHINQALTNLGFPDYIPEVTAARKAWEEETEAKARRQKANKNKLAESGKTPEELEREQEELFRQARERMNSLLSEAGTKPSGEGLDVVLVGKHMTQSCQQIV